ncbi:hypothetical protein [Sphingobium sp. ZW T5_29]|uniref:hypothetical protein n=1 Tax=Sphingobium sp. ZW T5_29 TaxID=3378077 RepID=UPI0038527BE6
MKATITNKSKALQGVWTVDGLQFIEPGQSKTLEIHEDHVEATKRLTSLLSFADPLDHDQNGKKGGAAEPVGEAATADEIISALALLDGTNDDHWTAAGLPKVESVAELIGKTVTRKAIEEAAPDAKRPTE